MDRHDGDFLKVTTLGVPAGGTFSVLRALNDANIACGVWGNSATGNPALRAFRWQANRMIDLNLPLGPNSDAYDISDDATICGWMGDSPETSSHGFIWHNGQVLDLGTVLPDAIGVYITGVNNLGSVCGYSIYHPAEFTYIQHAFIWRNGTVEELGVLAPYPNSKAVGISDSNVIVGKCSNATGVGPYFVWQDGVMHLLNDLIPASLQLQITYAAAINNSGQIAGEAIRLDGSGDHVAVRLTPIPATPGDFNCDHVVNVEDLLGVINHWGILGNTADFNHNGVVDLPDLIIVLEHWSR